MTWFDHNGTEFIKTNLEVNGSNPHTITKRPVRRLVFEFEEID